MKGKLRRKRSLEESILRPPTKVDVIQGFSKTLKRIDRAIHLLNQRKN